MNLLIVVNVFVQNIGLMTLTGEYLLQLYCKSYAFPISQLIEEMSDFTMSHVTLT